MCAHQTKGKPRNATTVVELSPVLLINTIAIVQRVLLFRITGGKFEVNKPLRKYKLHKELRNRCDKY